MKNYKMLISLVALEVTVTLLGCSQQEPIYSSSSTSNEDTSSSQQSDICEVSFVTTKCTVLVYENGTDYSFVPRQTNSTYAVDEGGNALPYDSTNELQVSFKVICDEGYLLGLDSFEIKGTYEAIVNNPMKDETPPYDDPMLWKISGIKSDLVVAITPSLDLLGM